MKLINPIYTLFIFFVLSILISSTSLADTPDQRVIDFKDGSTVVGNILAMNIDIVKIKIPDGRIMVKKFEDIVSISKTDNYNVTPQKKPMKNSNCYFGGNRIKKSKG